MYTSEFDELTLSRLYGVKKETVKKVVEIVDRYGDECIASIVIRIRNECNFNLNNYKHMLLIGHIIGVVSTGMYEQDLIKNLSDICQRQN